MKIFGKEIELPQLIVQSDVCQDVGLVPVIGVLPTLGDHGLGREVNDIGSLKLPDCLDDLLAVEIQVQLPEAKTRAVIPSVWEQAR